MTMIPYQFSTPAITPPHRESRCHPRVPVALRVELPGRQDGHDYAHDLSRGGLFLARVTDIEPGSLVPLQVTFPGFGSFRVCGRAIHRVTPEQAWSPGRVAGTGFEFVAPAPQFASTLDGYLELISGRQEARLFVKDLHHLRQPLAEAGYRVCEAPPPIRMAAVVAASRRILAVLMPEGDVPIYASVLEAEGLPQALVLGIPEDEPYESLLNHVDQRVLTRQAGRRDTRGDEESRFDYPVVALRLLD